MLKRHPELTSPFRCSVRVSVIVGIRRPSPAANEDLPAAAGLALQPVSTVSILSSVQRTIIRRDVYRVRVSIVVRTLTPVPLGGRLSSWPGQVSIGR